MVAVPLAWAAGDDILKVIESLRYGRTFKVRIQAASVLARLRDRRVVVELGRAAVVDRSASVRIYVLRLLGARPGGEPDDAAARAAIRRALSDRRSDVRREAERALAALDRRRAADAPAQPPPSGPLLVAVRGIGDRSGRASPALRGAFKAAIARQLRAAAGVRVVEDSSTTPHYAIDGSISRFVVTTVGTDAEVTCAVELVVSRPPRGIVMIASGEATVIEPRSSLRSGRQAGMEAEAVDHAVKSAHENLARFFASAR